MHQEEQSSQTGALDEVTADAASRQSFLKMVGGTGAAGALAIFVAACGNEEETMTATPPQAPPATPADKNMGSSQDLEIVNYALTLEYLEADFYAQVVAANLLNGAEQEIAKSFGDNEQEHVDALIATVKQLGGTPAEKPVATFPLEDRKSVLELVATVENLGAAAYLGQAGRIKNKEVLAAALAIHTVEARHAAALNSVVGKTITPDGAFAKPASMDEVLKAVQPFLGGGQ